MKLIKACMFFYLEPGQNETELNGLKFALSNASSDEDVSDWIQLQSFQNKYRYYIPVDPPESIRYLRVWKKTLLVR